MTVIDPERLSLQLYTVRAELDRDVEGAVARVAGIGFRQVEPFGLTELGPRLAGPLAEHGLAAPTSHAGLLGADLPAVFEAAAKLGTGTLIDPYVDPNRWQAEGDVRQIATELNEVAAKAKDHGLTIGYHNHHFELESRIGGRHALEVFAEHLDPAVVLEVDTYWAAVGGADVPALLERLGDRVVALHVKDGDGSLDNTAQVAVGAGMMPVPAILAAAPDSLAVVELDDFAGDMFTAVADSYAYLSEAA
jgi:sugar phosphate isomerase/epimerase